MRCLFRSLPPPPCLSTPKTSSNPPTFSLLAFSTRPISLNSVHSNGLPFSSHVRSSKTTDDMDKAEVGSSDFAKLRQNLEVHGVNIDSCTPGLYDLLVCPKCKGGRTMRRSLSFHVSQNLTYALWRCFDTQCGWAGQVVANSKVYPGSNIHGKIVSNLSSTRESLKLEVLGEELIDYFAERMISKETLQRNKVMQVSGQKKTIAFTYRQNGLLEGCKYRTIEKKFWQEKGTEKLLYGLDDITEADEIIIVEGEIDKLSMEEAGYYNCVSVPGGAPQTVSIKEPPSLDKKMSPNFQYMVYTYKDVSFQYLWNCKDYLDKASRIILATDGDIPGQALAEELARRIGRERCWQVRWPEKDDFSSFKDANEVLKILGADALRDAIDRAKPCELQYLN